MTRDQSIQWAREAGVISTKIGGIEAFAALVAAHEREECAKVCEAKALAEYPQTARGLGFSFSQQWDSARNAEKACAAAIRARGKA